jgi:hypothetical protein
VPKLSGITAVDNAVPARVIGELRTQITHAEAARDARTHWYSLEAPARHLIEQVIQHLRRFVPSGFVGAEWWFRATTPDTEFPFHFDRDEAIRRSIVSPGLATILYLSSAGGPTVILNATPSRVTAPSAGVAVHPRPGRFAMFPGALLHGVLPGLPSRWPRITLLVNWWRAEPRMERAAPLRLPASRPWRVERARAAELEPIEPARLLSNAAWRDVISNQTSYR